MKYKSVVEIKKKKGNIPPFIVWMHNARDWIKSSVDAFMQYWCNGLTEGTHYEWSWIYNT